MGVLTLLLGLAAVQAAAVRGKEEMSENPIRRIVNLLQMMAKEIEEHGWEKVQKHLHSTATAFDKTGKLLSDQALAENQLKQAQKVLSRMRSARKAAKKEALADAPTN